MPEPGSTQDLFSGPRIVQTKASAAYEAIRERIVDGRLVPGSVLDQEALARALGISTTPLREALRRLEMERFVDLSAHKEARVTPLTRQELFEVFDVRLLLEPHAAELVATNASDELIEEFYRLAERQPTAPSERFAYRRTSQRLFYGGCGNDILSALIALMRDRCDRYYMVLMEQLWTESSFTTYNMDAADALRGRDGPRLSKLVRAGIESTIALFESVTLSFEEPERQ